MEKFEDIRVLEPITHNKDKVYTTPPIEKLVTLDFNENTKWNDDKLPKQILEYGKIPPLDIYDLHAVGIDGTGVNVAIIDQPLALAHPEYKDNVVSYKTYAPQGRTLPISSMHGPAVASLLVGKQIGTAPKAKLHYYAVPSWLRDSIYPARALEDIVEQNKKLPDEEKIKFVSVSACHSGKASVFKNSKYWDEAMEKAKKAGILVLEVTAENGFISPGYIDYMDKSFKYGYPNAHKDRNKDNVYIPNSLRTVAECYDNKNFSYTYWGVGGVSWAIPYATGVLCLGQQVNPNLSAVRLKQIFIETAKKNDNIVAPKTFIEEVKKTLEINANEEDIYTP